MPSFAEVVKNNAETQFSYRPVAIFVGGTSGVGQGMAEKFAQLTKGNAHIIICGRNQAAAEAIFSTFPRTAESKYEFVYCDAFLMKNVVETCIQLKNRLSVVNFLVLTQGMFSFKGRTETAEGLDVKMALNFYSRWKFVDELLPLLQKATDQGQEARVMTVLSAIMSGKIYVNDIGLKKTYSFTASLRQVPAYNDLFVQEYAKRYPKMSFIHIYPGFVDTPLVRANWVMWLLRPILAVSMETCAEWMVYALWSSAQKIGPHHLDNHSDPVEGAANRNYEAKQKLVEHYKQAVAV